MHQGNWKCSSCGGAITELPFVPRSETGLTCRVCFIKSKGGSSGNSTSNPVAVTADEIPLPPDDASLASEPQLDDGFDAIAISPTGEKPRFSGDWSCSICGTAITSLPFTPKTTNNLKCLDCFKQSRA